MYTEYAYDTAGLGSHQGHVLPVVRDIVKDVPGSLRVVDLGCWNGSMLNAIANPMWTGIGVDASESGIALASQSFPGLDFICHDFSPGLVGKLGEQYLRSSDFARSGGTLVRS